MRASYIQKCYVVSMDSCSAEPDCVCTNVKTNTITFPSYLLCDLPLHDDVSHCKFHTNNNNNNNKIVHFSLCLDIPLRCCISYCIILLQMK